MALIAGADAGKSFLASLKWNDLQRLRRVIRKVHKAKTHREIDDKEADRLIEALGPKVVEDRLKMIVDAGHG